MAKSPGNHSLYKAFQSGDYCDLCIRLNDDSVLKVHRVVVSTQCEFFTNADKPGRFLASSGVIDMKNDPPQAIRRLVEFLYTGQYTVKGPENSDTNEPTPGATGLESPPDKDSESVLAHADVYVVSKTYRVPKLEEQAYDGIKSALGEPQTLEVFPQLVQTIYSGVPEVTCPVRDELLSYAQAHAKELITGEQLGSMIQNAPDLIEKLMRHLVSSDSTKKEQPLPADIDVKQLQDKVKEADADIERLQDKGKEADAEIERLQDKFRDARIEIKRLQEKVKGLGRYKCSFCSKHFVMALPANKDTGCPRCGYVGDPKYWRMRMVEDLEI